MTQRLDAALRPHQFLLDPDILSLWFNPHVDVERKWATRNTVTAEIYLMIMAMIPDQLCTLCCSPGGLLCKCLNRSNWIRTFELAEELTDMRLTCYDCCLRDPHPIYGGRHIQCVDCTKVYHKVRCDDCNRRLTLQEYTGLNAQICSDCLFIVYRQ